MTLEDAVAILNEKKHLEYDRWEIECDPTDPSCRWAKGAAYYDSRLPWEAIAVAEKYQREAAMQDPPRLETIVAEEHTFEYQRNRCTIYRFLTETQWVGMWEPIDYPHVSYGSMREWPTAAEAQRGLCDEIDRIAKLGA